ncbi:hypothetical protein Droror1_Dr00026051 [Drosera rotundifolia]
MKVMVAVDESEASLQALNWALTTLPLKDNHHNDGETSTLYLVHVHHAFQTYIYPAGPVVYATPMVMESVRKAQAEISRRTLAHALQQCTEKNMNKIKIETLMLEGNAKEMICQAVDKTRVDLLVLGSRSLGMIKRAFLGSVSDYCAHHAKCSVLIVKPNNKSK